MLAGEVCHLLDHPGRRIYRRAVCTLCRRRALAGGWVPSPEVAAPPVFGPEGDQSP
jgi:hypothetical protein